jgi:four helix bundle protein
LAKGYCLVGSRRSAVGSEIIFGSWRDLLISRGGGAEVPARNYRDLIVWQKAFVLAVTIYRETLYFPAEEKYGITSQLRRACVSIPSNIAEGEGRRSPSEFRRYLFIALGSLKEAETQILISDALGYFKPNEASKLMTIAAEVGRLLNGLSNSLSNR